MSYQLKLIGYPIQHSLSPWIHNQLLTQSGIEGSYDLFEIKPEDNFEERINQLKVDGTDGFNVTVPYKQKIIPYLDQLDDTAKEMQAVNTVVHKNGKWYGYNTDGDGYVRSIKSSYPKQFEEVKKILLIGAGGAARAIYYALAKENIVQIDIANRTKSKAEAIQNLALNKTTTTIYTMEEAEEVIQNYDLIIQTTSVGMKPKEHERIMKINELKEQAIVSDIVYQPIETSFLKEAKRLKRNVHYGHTMLLYQALYAFEIWTEKTVDVIKIEDKLQAILEGR